MKSRNWRDVAGLILVAWEVRQANNIAKAQESMMTATAWHFVNIFWSAQRAYGNGLLGDDDIFMYQSSLAWHIENHPGLRPAFKTIYVTAPWLRDMYVFQPLVELACGSETECDDCTAED